MGPQDEGVIHPATPLGITGLGVPRTSEEALLADSHASGRSDSSNWNHTNQGRAQPSDSDRKNVKEPQKTDMDGQTRFSRDAKAMATAIKPLSRSLETFLTKLSRTNERSEKSKSVFKVQDDIRMNPTVV